jgi:hypothetical protein
MYEPGDKREPRRYEPPPWEPPLQPAPEPVSAEAVEEPVGRQPEPGGTAQPAGMVGAAGAAIAPMPAIETGAGAERGATEAARPASKLPPDEEVDAMLAALRDEDAPREQDVAKWIGLGVNVGLVFFGVVMLLAGGLGVVRSGGNGLVMGSALLAFVAGVGMAGAGVWIGMRSTKGKD